MGFYKGNIESKADIIFYRLILDEKSKPQCDLSV